MTTQMHLRTTLPKLATTIEFEVQLIRVGDKFGLNNCLTAMDPEPFVEFYDTRYPFHKDVDGNVLGQFVSRYYLSTLKEIPIGNGLNLHGGVPEWQINGTQVQAVIAWAEQTLKDHPSEVAA